MLHKANQPWLSDQLSTEIYRDILNKFEFNLWTHTTIGKAKILKDTNYDPIEARDFLYGILQSNDLVMSVCNDFKENYLEDEARMIDFYQYLKLKAWKGIQIDKSLVKNTTIWLLWSAMLAFSPLPKNMVTSYEQVISLIDKDSGIDVTELMNVSTTFTKRDTLKAMEASWSFSRAELQEIQTSLTNFRVALSNATLWEACNSPEAIQTCKEAKQSLDKVMHSSSLSAIKSLEKAKNGTNNADIDIVIGKIQQIDNVLSSTATPIVETADWLKKLETWSRFALILILILWLMRSRILIASEWELSDKDEKKLSDITDLEHTIYDSKGIKKG